MQVGEGYLTEPVTVEYPTDNGQTAFMNYYPPKNQDFQLPPGETPPLLVKIHGGPTSQASTAFNLGYQYWTSRGSLFTCVRCLDDRALHWVLHACLKSWQAVDNHAMRS